jgi:hypothetical protein
MNSWLIENSSKRIPTEIIDFIIGFIPKSPSYNAINNSIKIFKEMFCKYYKSIKVYLLWYIRSTQYLKIKYHWRFLDFIQEDINNIEHFDEDDNTNIVNHYSYLIISSNELRQKCIDKYHTEINKEVDFNDPRINEEINEIYFTFTDEISNLFTHFCVRNNINNENKRIFALGCYYYLVSLVCYTEHKVKGYLHEGCPPSIKM